MIKPASRTSGDYDISRLLGHLPSISRIQRYYDSAEQKTHTIRNFDEWTLLVLNVGGRTRNHSFDHIDSRLMPFVRYAVSDMFANMDAQTVSTHLKNLRNCDITPEVLITSLVSDPHEFRDWWINNCKTSLSERQCGALKAVLRAFCRLTVGPWNEQYIAFVSRLPTPTKNRYNILDSGLCFLPVDHQGLVTDWLDEQSRKASSDSGNMGVVELRRACLVGLSFQLGLRPVQMAALKADDLLQRDGRVYARLLVAKQRDSRPSLVIRRLKPEWSAFWLCFVERRSELKVGAHAHPSSLFLLSSERLSQQISETLKRITGKLWSPNDLRHTGAQRLADAGASHVEIQDYLMHQTDGAANVYFNGSPCQAEKVNRAMGLSSIYQGVAKLARVGMIDRQVLEELPWDQQIGGVPHGMPISGIGACELGQSHCVKNPVLSCYGCRNFLPLNDREIHQKVADGLRGVVHDFYSVIGDAEASPAYGQLRRTIEAADYAASEADEIVEGARR